jgi:hypothetical protein
MSKQLNCPKCEAEIGDSYEPDDPSVGIYGGWYCDACDLAIGEHEFPREPLEDDVPIISATELRGERPIGTPISELSGRPGDKGYAEFCRIARSWGYE